MPWTRLRLATDKASALVDLTREEEAAHEPRRASGALRNLRAGQIQRAA
jgi:hypothetical protein